jgi:hypothetical protein
VHPIVDTWLAVQTRSHHPLVTYVGRMEKRLQRS